MLLSFILTGLGGLAILMTAELLWRERKKHGEGSRKFVHIAVGSYIAFWPLWLSWREIEIISFILVCGVLASKYFKIFKTVHSVGRTTWGELCFAVSVGLIAFLTQQPWIYFVAILHMSLADGLAAIVGTKYGKKTSYFILKHQKSLAGSATFFAISYALLVIYYVAAQEPPQFIVLLVLPLLATALENIAVLGLDNIAVPILVTLVLTYFS